MMMLIVILGGAYYLYSTGTLDSLLKAPASAVPTPAPAPAPAPRPSGGRRGGDEAESEPAPAPTTGGGGGGAAPTGTGCGGGTACASSNGGSRNECDGISFKNYEATWCGTFSGDDLSIKTFGPSHSGSSCCWCILSVSPDGVFGIRHEGPHPSTSSKSGATASIGKPSCIKAIVRSESGGINLEGWGLVGGTWKKAFTYKGPCGESKKSTTPAGSQQVSFRCDGSLKTTCATVKSLDGGGGGGGASAAGGVMVNRSRSRVRREPLRRATVSAVQAAKQLKRTGGIDYTDYDQMTGEYPSLSANAYAYQAATGNPLGDLLKPIFEFLDSIFKPKQPAAAPAPAPTAAPPSPVAAGPTTGGPSSVTGTNIYKVVGSIQTAGTGVTLRGGGTSNRDNIGYPCNKCARESTWIFKPGSGGDWSLKLGSHGDEGGKETLIELGNIDTNGGGGDWRCEGPHMTYKDVAGGSGKAPAIGGRARVGAKAVTWPLGGNRIHHEIYMDMTGAGNRWQKVAQFDGAATGCNAITCPVPGSKCQDTLRLDNVKGHQFFSRSIVEIVPGAGAVGGGGAIPVSTTTTTPTAAKKKGPPPNPTPVPQPGFSDRLPSGKPSPITPATVKAVKAVIMSPPTTDDIRTNAFHSRISWLRSKYYDTRPGGRHAAPLEQTATGMPTSYQATLETGAIPITYETATSRMLLFVKLNNSPKPVTMKLDTGAASTLISKADADATGISKLTPLDSQSITSGGTSAATTRYNVTMQIGSGAPFQTIINVRSVATDAPASLSRMDLEKSGYSAVLTGGNLRLVKRGTSVVAPALTKSPTHHGVMIDISINGNPLNIIYDTGVTSTILNGADAAKAKLDLTKPAGTVDVQSATGGVRKDPYFMVQMKIGTGPAFQTKVNVNASRPVSTLSGADLIKSGNTAILTAGKPQYVPKGTRVVAPALTTVEYAPARSYITGPGEEKTYQVYQTTATQSMATGTLDVGTAGGMVILIPNEGHHGPTDKQTQFPGGNAVFVPGKAIIPTGCEVVWLSDDPGHSHTINVTGMGSTKSIGVDGASAPMKFTKPGTFAYSSKSYAGAGQKGTITVSAKVAVPGKVVGALFVPASDVAKYRTMMATAGCTVLSTAPASKKASGQSVSDHQLLVYSANGTAAAVASKLGVVTKATPYT